MLSGRKWHKVEGASPVALEHLKAIAPVQLPESYLSMLAFSNGGEGPLPVKPLNFCLYSAEEVAQIELAGTFREFFPNLFVIGGNGGSAAVALDLSVGEPYPLIFFDMTNIDLAESVRLIAASFDAALDLVGRDD